MTRQYQNTETRRRQVAEAALRTIMEDGVVGFTTRAVAARVGISDGTLFRHFGNKKEIMLEAMTILEEEIEVGLVNTDDPVSDLKVFFRHRAKFVGARDAVGALIFSEELFHLAGEEGKKKVEHWRQRSVGYLISKLKELRGAGFLKDELEIPEISILLQGVLLTFVMQRSHNSSIDEKQLTTSIDRSWNTIRKVLFK